jgi:hypothetical protein
VREIFLEQAALQILVRSRLREQGGRDVGGGRFCLDLRRETGWQDEIPDAQPGSDRLGEGRAVDDIRAAVQLEERWQRLPLETDETVWVVFDEQHVVLTREPDESAATCLRQRHPARVLKRRDRVQKRGPQPLAEHQLERIDIQALVVERDCEDLGAHRLQQLQRTVVCGCLDEHGAARGQAVGEEEETLE